MAHVGKEAHVHAVDALFLLLLLTRLAHQLLPFPDAHHVAYKEDDDAAGQQQVEAPGPPREPGCGVHRYLDGALGLGGVKVAAVGPDAEGVVAGRQVGVGRFT